MKFIELKNDLSKKIRPAYLISGNDRFLCYSALSQIKKALKIEYPQMNEVILSGETTSVEEIARSASVFPFMDTYRLVQVNDFSSKTKSKKADDELIAYLKNPMNESVIVFFSLDDSDALKPYMQFLTEINCDKLDPDTIVRILTRKLADEKIQMSQAALLKLVMFSSCDMARINSELEKLAIYKAGEEISEKDVEDLVEEDREYQVFQLSEFIAKKDKKHALDLLDVLGAGRSGFSIIAPLYNNFRRALFVCINRDKTDDELANLLGVKNTYAIKMTRSQVAFYTPRKLKSIIDMLYEVDKNIKTGKIKEDIAIKTVVLGILKIRG